MNNLHIIKVKYLGATNHRGSRVKLISDRFTSSVTLSFDYKYNNAGEQALDYLIKRGFVVLGIGEIKGIEIIASSTFEDIK